MKLGKSETIDATDAETIDPEKNESTKQQITDIIRELNTILAKLDALGKSSCAAHLSLAIDSLSDDTSAKAD